MMVKRWEIEDGVLKEWGFIDYDRLNDDPRGSLYTSSRCLEEFNWLILSLKSNQRIYN